MLDTPEMESGTYRRSKHLLNACRNLGGRKVVQGSWKLRAKRMTF
jgi:hypothetical protein